MYEQLRTAAQADLGAFVEVGLGCKLWSVQKDIATAFSDHRARVAVASCNSSGKSKVASGLALAAFWAFQPGEPCIICKGPCGGVKVITTSSKEAQLADVLWAEIRTHLNKSRVPFPAKPLPRELRLWGGPDHFLIGQNPAAPEGMQGYHAPHVFVIADEATSVPEGLASAINTLLASGDARLLLIFNPTTEDTWAYTMFSSPAVHSLRIRAWDTPHFTGEPVPPGASLISQAFLDEMSARGEGPGSYEWETRIEAQFWSQGSNMLITPEQYDMAATRAGVEGPTVFGVDLASFGDTESVIAVRQGNRIVDIIASSSMRPDLFWESKVRTAVQDYNPQIVVWDAEGPGAGSYGDAQRVVGRHRLYGFRGSVGAGGQYKNLRAMWWWMLRQRFEMGDISLGVNDPTLRKQMLSLRYRVNDQGLIQMDSKDKMHDRGEVSPDRADAVMYSFATEAPTIRKQVKEKDLKDRSADEEMFWKRQEKRRKAYVPIGGSSLI